MAIYEHGVAYHTHYVRLSESDTIRLRKSAVALGAPMTEIFRRALTLYWEVEDGAQTTATLTKRQQADQKGKNKRAALSPSTPAEPDRFNLTGDD